MNFRLSRAGDLFQYIKMIPPLISSRLSGIIETGFKAGLVMNLELYIMQVKLGACQIAITKKNRNRFEN